VTVATRRAVLAGVAALPFAARSAPARRIVVAGGDLAEIAFALGAGASIVGADSTALHPPEAAALPRVGYLRRLSAEGVLSLSPDLVIAGAAAGPAVALDQLRAAGVAVEIGPDAEGVAALGAKIAFMGRALDRGAEAAALAAAVDARFARLAAALDGLDARPAVLCLISAARGAPLAAGAGTAPDALIELAAGRNAMTHADYKPLSAEAAIGAAPEALLMPTHAIEAVGGPAAALALPGLATTPAGAAGRLVAMDPLLLLGLGPRTPEAAAKLARALHPERADRLTW
jgi:iron complex transport system substrate-binding protein